MRTGAQGQRKVLRRTEAQNRPKIGFGPQCMSLLSDLQSEGCSPPTPPEFVNSLNPPQFISCGGSSHQTQQTILASEFMNGILQSFHWSFAVTLQAEIQYEAAAKDLRKKIRKDQRRRDELDVLLKRLYESYALGKLPEKRYEALSAEYEQEQAALEISLAEDQHSLEIFLEDTTRIDQFMELAKKYTDLSELTTPMLNEFVDKILVHAPVKDPKYGRMQQMDVYLNFVGCVQIPSPEPTAEELEELERLARRREINKRTYARRKERERQKKLLTLEQAGQEEASF